jgi:ankyrin repeat protein
MALSQGGLDVNSADRADGLTAAYAAAEKGHAQCLSILSQHNADLSKADKHGWAPIHVACQNGRYACLEVLLDNGVNTSLPVADEHGFTPLIVASQNGHVKCMALLLDRGSDPNLARSDGFTAVHAACQYGQLKCLQLLSKRDANLNVQDSADRTPLDIARLLRQPVCIDHLLTSGRAIGMDVEDLPPTPESQKVCKLRHSSFSCQ